MSSVFTIRDYNLRMINCPKFLCNYPQMNHYLDNYLNTKVYYNKSPTITLTHWVTSFLPLAKAHTAIKMQKTNIAFILWIRNFFSLRFNSKKKTVKKHQKFLNLYKSSKNRWNTEESRMEFWIFIHQRWIDK